MPWDFFPSRIVKLYRTTALPGQKSCTFVQNDSSFRKSLEEMERPDNDLILPFPNSIHPSLPQEPFLRGNLRPEEKLYNCELLRSTDDSCSMTEYNSVG